MKGQNGKKDVILNILEKPGIRKTHILCVSEIPVPTFSIRLKLFNLN